jgi:hypothetical protein
VHVSEVDANVGYRTVVSAAPHVESNPVRGGLAPKGRASVARRGMPKKPSPMGNAPHFFPLTALFIS